MKCPPLTAAERYLPAFIADFNGRFGNPPAAAQAVWRRPRRDLPLVLSGRYRRVVARDNTVRLATRWVQLPGARSYAGRSVDVRELLDGRLVVLRDGVICGETASPGPTFILKPRGNPSHERRRRRSIAVPRRPVTPVAAAAKAHTGRRPLPTHPWVIRQNTEIRLHELRTGRTFSRRSDGGPSH